MSGEWRPATMLEQALLDAVRTGDQHRYLDLLYGTELLLPVGEDGGWVTATVEGRSYLLGYTSLMLLQRAYGYVVSNVSQPFAQLIAAWPDPDWWLVVNPGTPIEVHLPPGHLHRRTSPPESEPEPGPEAAEPEPGPGPGPGPEPEAAEPQPLPRAARPASVFRPVNETEQMLLGAVDRGDADSVLKALLLTELVLPVPDDAPGDLTPGAEEFRWRVYQSDGELCVPVFTSATRCAEMLGSVPTVLAEGLEVVHAWPEASLSLVLNPGTPVGASLPGPQVMALAEWAAEVGLIDILFPDGPPASHPLVLEKLIPHQNVAHYLQQGYDLVSGLVHPAADTAELSDLDAWYATLGLDPGAGFTPGDPAVHLVRWVSPLRPALGPPQAGRIRQFRLAGQRLPHGAELRRRERSGAESLVAVYDADTAAWRPVQDTAGWPVQGVEGP